MAALTICSDFGAPQNKVSHCFHCFPIYLSWSDGTWCHDLRFLNVEHSANFSHSPLSLSSRGSSSFSAIRVVSSVCMRLLIFLPEILISACASSSPAFLMMYSAYKLNKQGDNIQPLHNYFPIWNQSVVPCPVLTVASWPAYTFLKRQVRWSGIPMSQNFRHFIVIHTVKGFGIVNKAEIDVFLELLLFQWSSRCWKFDLWFLCLFWDQLEYLEVLGSCIAEAWLGQFWALPY